MVRCVVWNAGWKYNMHVNEWMLNQNGKKELS